MSPLFYGGLVLSRHDRSESAQKEENRLILFFDDRFYDDYFCALD
jgi:hypothetical protein